MKIKKFWEKHKENIAIAGVYIVGFSVLGVTLYKVNKYFDGKADEIIKPVVPKVEHLEVPEKLKGLGFDMFDNYSGAVELMTDSKYDSIKVSDLGKLGEALSEFPGIDKDCFVWTLINVKKNVTE